MAVNGNGYGHGTAFYKWAVALLTSMCLAGGAWSFSRISSLEEKAARVDERVLNIVGRLEKLDSSLTRVDDKLEDIQITQQRMTFLIVAKDNPELMRSIFPVAHP